MELVPFELANEYKVPKRGNGIGRFEIGDTLLVWCGTEQVPFYLHILPFLILVPLGHAQWKSRFVHNCGYLRLRRYQRNPTTRQIGMPRIPSTCPQPVNSMILCSKSSC